MELSRAREGGSSGEMGWGLETAAAVSRPVGGGRGGSVGAAEGVGRTFSKAEDGGGGMGERGRRRRMGEDAEDGGAHEEGDGKVRRGTGTVGEGGGGV